ncbi:MAG: hypothetical protein ACRYGG_00235 [Janthinobacterium lividum]
MASNLIHSFDSVEIDRLVDFFKIYPIWKEIPSIKKNKFNRVPLDIDSIDAHFIGYQSDEKIFKSYLHWVFKLGKAIILKIRGYEHLIPIYYKQIEIFNREIKFSTTAYKRPFNYDWFHFSVTYPMLLAQCIIVSRLYALDRYTFVVLCAQIILQFIPDIDTSIGYKREGSNMVLMSIPHFIAKWVLNETPNIANYLLRLDKIDYVKAGKSGLLSDGTYLFHKSLRAYNYLFVYLPAAVFYNRLVGLDIFNIEERFKFLEKIFHFGHYRVHPSIVTRAGSFLQMYTDLKNTLDIAPDLLPRAASLLANPNLQTFGIYEFPEGHFISAIYPEWSCTIVSNCEYNPVECDIYNGRLLRQIWQSKIINYSESIEKFTEDLLYPGIFFNSENKYKSEDLYSKLNDYRFDSVVYGQKSCSSYGITYSVIKNKIFQIEYTEICLVSSVGLIVCYLNIVHPDEKRHFLCTSNNDSLAKRKIYSRVLYNDFNQIGNQDDDVSNDLNINQIEELYKEREIKYIMCGKNVIYFNGLSSPDVLACQLTLANSNNLSLKLTINNDNFNIFVKNDRLKQSLNMGPLEKIPLTVVKFQGG